MFFVRRSRRMELIVLGSIMILLIWNLIYFQRIELKLNSNKYLSMGSSDRDQSNEFVWPSDPTLSSDEDTEYTFVGPENLQQPVQRNDEKLIENRNDESIADHTTTTPLPAPDKKPKPHPLKKPKTKEQSANTIQITPEIPMCPETSPNLIGQVELDKSEETIDVVEVKLSEILRPGGYYTPSKCQPRHSVALIIPYRNQSKNLAIFLKNIHPFLIKQQIEYRIFVVEQTVGTKFNRGMLFNVGYLEAKKMKNWNCFIFHDVDLLPLNDRISYTCSKNPRHLAVSVDKLDNKLPSYDTLNGALAVTSEQFEKMNGYSNLFWGSDGEHLDLANRLKYVNYEIDRIDEEIARYTMLSGDAIEPSIKRLDLVRDGNTKFKTIGLNSIKYTVQCIDESPAYTWIFVTLKPEVPGDESNVEQLGVK